ncbi:hypothetical protein PFLUV_G00045330 [Perca fluviatilis]|uniref:Uncharacterized protein n=1 Tax=Perca fluviatilis TaxID=8168 RepID=A0A6A5FCJ0_PERFL|nr:hypothetical protein PFLUV_G00045330 [Perca fluviatilis]
MYGVLITVLSSKKLVNLSKDPTSFQERATAVSPPTAHRTEPTATVSRPAEPDDSSGIVASVKARLKAPLPAPSSSSAQMICGLQHVELSGDQ